MSGLAMSGLGAYLVYFGASAGLWALGLAAYMLATPYRELALIRAGNVAAACSLSGAAIGLALPIASTVAHSVGFADMALWAGVAAATQVAVYLVASVALPGLKGAIADNGVAQGLFLGMASVAVGVLNAAALPY